MRERLYLGIIVIGSIIRLIEPIFLNPLDRLFSDPKRHWDNGLHFYDQATLTIANDPPGFQLFMHYLQLATGQNRWAIGIAFGLLSAVFPWLWYRAAKELNLARKLALPFYAVLVWTPSLLTIFSYVMTEALLLPMLGLSLWISARHLRKASLIGYLTAVATWTLTCQIKAIVLPVGAMACLYCWLARGRQFSHLAWALSVFVLLLLPNTIRTYHLLGYCAPFGSSWGVRLQLESGARVTRFEWDKGHYIFSSPSMYVAPLWPLSLWGSSRNISNVTYTVVVDPCKGSTDWVLNESHLHYTWSNRLTDHVENAIFLLFSPSWPEYNFYTPEGWLNYWIRWIWGPLIFWIIAQNIQAYRTRVFDLIPVLTTILLLFLLLQNEAVTEGRYRKPLEPFVLMNLFWNRRQEERKEGAIGT
jgi:hypothetical protein